MGIVKSCIYYNVCRSAISSARAREIARRIMCRILDSQGETSREVDRVPEEPRLSVDDGVRTCIDFATPVRTDKKPSRS